MSGPGVHLSSCELPGGVRRELRDLGGGGRYCELHHPCGGVTRWAVQPGDTGADARSWLVEDDIAAERQADDVAIAAAGGLSSWEGLMQGIERAPAGSGRLFALSAEAERRLMAEMEAE